VPDAILALIEEQQRLELVVMLGWKARYECNLLLDASLSRRATPATAGRPTLRAAQAAVEVHIIP
jgi:hypothetical protein